MRNASSGPGFFGKTSKAFTDWYSLGVSHALVESEITEGLLPPFWAALSPLHIKQLNIKVMIRPEISDRILMPVMVFMVVLFGLTAPAAD
jgi:hypothetical protein